MKPQNLLSWDDLRLVLAIDEQRSLSGAARVLAISHPTLTRRLRDVEERLGCRLVERSPQSCNLTPAGEDARNLAEKFASEIANLERRIGGRDKAIEGPVRLTAPDAVADYLLPPVMATVGGMYPRVTIDLQVSNQIQSLAQGKSDIALRVTDTPSPTLKGRRIATVAMAVYGVDHLPDIGEKGIRKVPWIGFDDSLACSGPSRWLEREVGQDAVRFRANTLPAAARAATSGTGYCILPCFIGESVESLKRHGDPVPELDTGLWLLVHPEIADLPRVKAVREAMAAELLVRRPVISVGRP
jgi:DNA-binding transcriptional LysR family regulator